MVSQPQPVVFWQHTLSEHNASTFTRWIINVNTEHILFLSLSIHTLPNADPHVVQALQNLNKESKSFDSEQLPEFSQLTELISKLSDSLNCPTFSDSMVEHDLV